MPPDLFIDRSLGTIAVPNFFRSVWPADVRTLDEVYGMDKIADSEWMRRVDEEGWVACCKDGRIRTRPGERELMSGGTLRVFCLANGNLLTSQQVAHFRHNLDSMVAQASAPGPWLFADYTNDIKPMRLYPRVRGDVVDRSRRPPKG